MSSTALKAYLTASSTSPTYSENENTRILYRYVMYAWIHEDIGKIVAMEIWLFFVTDKQFF